MCKINEIELNSTVKWRCSNGCGRSTIYLKILAAYTYVFKFINFKTIELLDTTNGDSNKCAK